MDVVMILKYGKQFRFAQTYFYFQLWLQFAFSNHLHINIYDLAMNFKVWTQKENSTFNLNSFKARRVARPY